MPSPTTTWICDSCGEPINTPREGWVQWLRVKDADGTFHSEGLQLVHASHPSRRGKPRCLYDGDAVFRQRKATQADLSLTDFVGPDGLMRLLSFLSEDEFKDRKEVIEMIKRLFVNGYEEARPLLEAAVHQGVFEPNTPAGFPHQAQIDEVLEWKRQRGDD